MGGWMAELAMHSEEKTQRLLARATEALDAGRRGTARWLLRRVVRLDRKSELGWLLLSEVVRSEREQRACLSRVLRINAYNDLALRRLDTLTWQEAQRSARRSARSPLRAAIEAVRNPGAGAMQSVAPPAADQQEPQGAAGRMRAAAIRRPVALALGYGAALAVAEILTALVEPRLGLTLHALLLAALAMHTALTWGHATHRLLLCLAMAPLIRILSLSLPLQGLPIVYWYAIISLPLFAAAAAVARALGMRAGEIGLRMRWPWLQLGMTVLGLGFGYAEYLILRPAPLTQSLSLQAAWLPALILLVSTGFSEELIFRGVMQKAATEAMGKWGMLYVAGVFAVLHVGYKSVVDVLFVFGVALVFGWVAARTRSIVGVSLAHGLTNIVLFTVAPFVIGGLR